MPIIFWNELRTFEINQPTDFSAPWLMIVDALRDATYLQIKAAGEWSQGDVDCGPDGVFGTSAQGPHPAMADCPVGALIGKIGGSSAGSTPAAPTSGGDASASSEGKPFAIGVHCVIAVPAKSLGPLFISFNNLPRPVRVRHLRITVSGATLGS